MFLSGLTRQASIQYRQFFGKFGYVVDHQEVPFTEYASYVLIRAWIKAHAVGQNAASARCLHCLFGVLSKVLGVTHINVSRFTIGDNEE